MKRKETEEPEADAEASGAEAPAADEDELARLAREREEFRVQWQRAQADYQNLRRRHLAEIDASRRRTLQPLLENLLTVLDHLDMALATECTNAESENLALGVSMTRDQFLRALAEEGVKPIPTEGAFDPELHEAVSTVSDADAEPGSIVDTVRGGWSWGDQVLRHARVVVAGDPGGPAAPAPDDAPAEESRES